MVNISDHIHKSEGSYAGAFWGLVIRDLRLAWGQGGTAAMVLSFFLIALSLFPFGIGPAPQTLARVAPGLLYVVALLATLISLDRLYQADFEDGFLDQLAMTPLGLTGSVIAKVLAHWFATLLPVTFVAPFVGLMINLPVAAAPTVFLSLLIAGPALSLIGSVGAALTVGLRRGGVLLSLVVLPLYIPTLIFGTAAVDAAIFGGDIWANMALLLATTLVAFIVGIPASIAGLKLALD